MRWCKQYLPGFMGMFPPLEPATHKDPNKDHSNHASARVSVSVSVRASHAYSMYTESVLSMSCVSNNP